MEHLIVDDDVQWVCGVQYRSRFDMRRLPELLAIAADHGVDVYYARPQLGLAFRDHHLRIGGTDAAHTIGYVEKFLALTGMGREYAIHPLTSRRDDWVLGYDAYVAFFDDMLCARVAREVYSIRAPHGRARDAVGQCYLDGCTRHRGAPILRCREADIIAADKIIVQELAELIGACRDEADIIADYVGYREEYFERRLRLVMQTQRGLSPLSDSASRNPTTPHLP